MVDAASSEDDDYPSLRELRSPVSAWDLRPLDPRCRVVQFAGPLNSADYDRVAAFMLDHPDVPVRAYRRVPDLEWLRHFPALRRLSVNCCESWLASLDGLRYLPPDLVELDLGRPARRLSIASISRFQQLQTLHLEGDFADYPTIAQLRSLQDVFLSYSKLRDLELLSGMPQLRRVGLMFGGTKGLGALTTLPALEDLSLTQVRGLADLSVLAHLTSLRRLDLDSLRNVTELPDLSSLTQLTEVVISNMSGLTSLERLAQLPALERLTLRQMSLSVEQVAVFQGHPTLRVASLGIGSVRRREQAQQLLGVPAI